MWKSEEANTSNSDISAAAIEHGFQSPEGHSKLIMDGPWRLLWPCLLLWPLFETAIGLGFIHNARSKALDSSADLKSQTGLVLFITLAVKLTQLCQFKSAIGLGFIYNACSKAHDSSVD